MESYLREDFEVMPKGSSEEVLERWRKLCGLVKNPRRRFRFTANLSKRYEAAAMGRANERTGLSTGDPIIIQVRDFDDNHDDKEERKVEQDLYTSKVVRLRHLVTRPTWIFSPSINFPGLCPPILRVFWLLNHYFCPSKVVTFNCRLSKAFLKWLFIVLNVGVEACQAALAQEAAQGKLGRQMYLKLSIVTSSVCLMMSLVEAFLEGRSNRVVWQQKGLCCWFYYPGLQGRLFGRFSVYFGIICSMVQLFFNSIAEVTKKEFVKFDYVPLLLSVCYLVAAMIASQEKTFLATVKCESHGYNAPEATTVDGHGRWVFECPKCQMENYS